MVVSEIGEQWSPQTAPARHADIPMMESVPLPAGKIASTIGISIPKVPQEVPVAKASTHATIKITAGKSFASVSGKEFIISPTKNFAPSSPVIFLRAVANVKIRIAGTIAIKPWGIASIDSLNVVTFLTHK